MRQAMEYPSYENITNLFIFIFLLCLSSSKAFTENSLLDNQILCPSLQWGFEFKSSNKVKVINTDLNKITTIDEYNFEVDLELSYINIFFEENKKRNRVYSIELNSLRVDVWSMTGGGFTAREMFPIGLCKFVEINDYISYIENLK